MPRHAGDFGSSGCGAEKKHQEAVETALQAGSGESTWWRGKWRLQGPSQEPQSPGALSNCRDAAAWCPVGETAHPPPTQALQDAPPTPSGGGVGLGSTALLLAAPAAACGNLLCSRQLFSTDQGPEQAETVVTPVSFHVRHLERRPATGKPNCMNGAGQARRPLGGHRSHSGERGPCRGEGIKQIKQLIFIAL